MALLLENVIDQRTGGTSKVSSKNTKSISKQGSIGSYITRVASSSFMEYSLHMNINLPVIHYGITTLSKSLTFLSSLRESTHDGL